MKIKGVDLGKPYIEPIVFPRGEGIIVLQAQAVLDYSEFYNLCPAPIPREGLRKDPATGQMVPFKDTTNKEYQAQMYAWSIQKVSWMVLESLKATPDLEWDTIVPNDPSTWGNYAEELKKANFTTTDIDRIVDGVLTVCGLNEAKIQEATKSFLAGRAAQHSAKSSPSSEQDNTPSGEPVNGLA